TLPHRVELAAIETLRRCLVVERLCRRLLLGWLDLPDCLAQLRRALYDMPASARRLIPLADGIIAQARLTDETTDADLIEAASFGQLVLLIERAGLPVPSGLLGTLWQLVEARNAAAHGRCPMLFEFIDVMTAGSRAMRGL